MFDLSCGVWSGWIGGGERNHFVFELVKENERESKSDYQHSDETDGNQWDDKIILYI